MSDECRQVKAGKQTYLPVPERRAYWIQVGRIGFSCGIWDVEYVFAGSQQLVGIVVEMDGRMDCCCEVTVPCITRDNSTSEPM